ncbi:MAG: BamA/TamA family outer membrane protein, partial [Methylobacter sp.]|nr:BamA/TamA family outer membrane protein [Methylobacter sp.]
TTLSATSYSSNQICDFIYGNESGTDACANASNGNVIGAVNSRPKVKATGSSFLTLAPAIGWTHDTLNRAIFPNKGGQQRFSALATVPGSDLQYYKVGYKHQLYFPLAKDFTFRLQAEAGYGNGYGKTTSLPFFENYFGGGTGSIRGFKNNTVGPRDSNGYPFGGSSKIIGNAELFFPVPFMPETKSVRLGTFLDAGSINNGFKANNLKYSVGVSGEWLSPFGALSVSAALPLNAKSTATDPDGTITGDQKQMFQFNFGQNF